MQPLNCKWSIRILSLISAFLLIGKRPAPIPISRSLGDPNTPTSNINQVQLGSLLNHRFNEDWAIHSRFLASFDDVNQTFVTPTPAFNPARALDQATGIMQRNVSYEENNNEKYATNLDLTEKLIWALAT